MKNSVSQLKTIQVVIKVTDEFTVNPRWRQGVFDNIKLKLRVFVPRPLKEV